MQASGSRSVLAVLGCALLLFACSADSDNGGSSGKNNGGFGNAAGTTGTGNGSSGTNGGGGTGFVHVGEGEGCATADIRAARVTPTIWLVVDGSGSMTESFGNSDRWQSLREALMEQTAGVVPQLESAVVWGMVMYDGPFDINSWFPPGFFGGGADAGMPAPTTCPRLVVVEPALNNFMPIDAMYPAEPLGGSTPTHKAMEAILTRVSMNMPGPDEVVQPTYVVLATDGAPNDLCGGGMASADPPGSVISATQAIAAKGVKTYVISLAGDDADLQAHLEQVAMAGGTGKPPFTPMSKDDLLQTFNEIIGGAVGCEVRLNGKVTIGSECAGYVNVNGKDLKCNDPNGWRLKDEQTVEITGTECTAFKSDPEAALHANFPCDVFSPD